MVAEIFKIALLLLCSVCGTLTDENKPIVSTPFGKVRGSHDVSFKGKTYSSFVGVPYAQPPIGILRFREPQEHKGWSGLWEANITSTCIQISHEPEPEGGILIGDEDCLYLNVYVPRKKPNQGENLDVVVHIHGGALNFGYGHLFGPKFLFDNDEVVFVTLNYRVGPLGFLSTEDEVVPGNNGMKDQSMALRWIKENVKYFGGNPDSIMITGLSAGGASVHFHYLSALSKGLFSSGVSMSGTALCPWPFQEAALEKARTLAASVGCRQQSTMELVECLRERPAIKIVESVRMFRPWLYNPFSPFGIVVEKNGDNPFLTDYPYKLLKEGKVQDVPWLTSVTSHEGLYPAADYMLKDHYLTNLEKRWVELAPHVLDYNYTVILEEKESVAFKVKEHYLGGKPISLETFSGLVQMMSDRLFVVDAEKAARLQAKANNSPVHFYYYSYQGEDMPSLALLWSHSSRKWGVSHGDELPYLLSIDGLTDLSDQDANVQKILMGIWLSMAKERVPKIEGIQWKQVSKSAKKLDYVHIKGPNNVVPEQAVELGHRSFWESLLFLENERLLAKGREEL